MEERRQILMIARESMSNVLRHANATVCRITLEAIEGRLHLSIEDDGIGFRPAVLDTQCRGVGNMEARARQIGATLDIASETGRGTRIMLETVRREVHV
jgi:signal transduction histidine kinase